MTYTIDDIAAILGIKLQSFDGRTTSQLLTDSRKIHLPAETIFFALKGARRDGHQYIPDLFNRGIRFFVVSADIEQSQFPSAVFLRVNDPLEALQSIATAHRQRFHYPVIGITGSNGKTIVKEWLYQLMESDRSIVRSPKSYNSQIGVPLSVWQMQEQHQLAIIEAGISSRDEMERLEKIIRPSIGILTSLGEAHSEGFTSLDEKIQQKFKLFEQADMLVYSPDHLSKIVDNPFKSIKQGQSLYTWSRHNNAFLTVKEVVKSDDFTVITAAHNNNILAVQIPFTDDASVDNALTCWTTMLAMEYEQDIIADRMKKLHVVNMRLELRKGINNCSIINDSYSADLNSLDIALAFLDQQKTGQQKTVILSDFLQTAIADEVLYKGILESLRQHGVDRLIGIGEKISQQLAMPRNQETGIRIELFSTTDDFTRQYRSSMFRDETILVKGARKFAFEEIVQLLELKSHQTVLEINLNALAHNLKQYQQILHPRTKVMAMVKAFAYGSGGAEIAATLEFHKVDYLGVAYADEGVELRKAGISLPIMVMNPEERSFAAITEHQLEPEIYSFSLLEAFNEHLQREGLRQYPVHLEIETGMNRLGFAADAMDRLSSALLSSDHIRVQSVFSHLAASEDPAQDNFTQQQYDTFKRAANFLQQHLKYDFLLHIANSAAITRSPHMQLDMVRLGIGMYGVDATRSLDLQPVATLRSTIAQVKTLLPGESVSYNRRAIVEHESTIATLRIGYADGYPRRLGNGVGEVFLHGKLVPVIGTVCMDMIMIDITGLTGVREGDEVVIFGADLPVEDVARKAGTIPYEIMTGISHRVKRVYYQE